MIGIIQANSNQTHIILVMGVDGFTIFINLSTQMRVRSVLPVAIDVRFATLEHTMRCVCPSRNRDPLIYTLCRRGAVHGGDYFKAQPVTRACDFKAHYNTWIALKNNTNLVSNVLLSRFCKFLFTYGPQYWFTKFECPLCQPAKAYDPSMSTVMSTCQISLEGGVNILKWLMLDLWSRTG